jgi:hypothetical protein
VEEIMRLDWADVWRVEGHIEISVKNAKTRQRRLVETCPALAQWLTAYQKKTGQVFGAGRGRAGCRDVLGLERPLDLQRGLAAQAVVRVRPLPACSTSRMREASKGSIRRRVFCADLSEKPAAN